MSQTIQIQLSDQAFSILQQKAQETGTSPDDLAARALEIQYCAKQTPSSQPALALASFMRDLPGLLTSHSGEWVAYCGDSQIGFHASQRALVQKCLQRGLAENDFLVFSIEPQSNAEIGDLRDV